MTEREPLAAVLARGDLRESLEAMRDRLAEEIDDIRWAKHRRECSCKCGMADVRALAATTKQLHAFIDAIEALPVAEGSSRLDRIAAAHDDELAQRRTRGRPAAASS